MKKRVLVLLIALMVPFALMAAAVETIKADSTTGGIPQNQSMPSAEVEWTLAGFQEMTVGFYKDENDTALTDEKVSLSTSSTGSDGSSTGVFGTGTVYVNWDIVSGVGVKIGIYAQEALMGAKNGNTTSGINWSGTLEGEAGDSGSDPTFGGEGGYTTDPTTETSKVASILDETGEDITEVNRSGSQKITIWTEDASGKLPDTYSGTVALVISLVE